MPSETVHPYRGPERRAHPLLTEEQLEHIAELAAEKALKKMKVDTQAIAKQAAVEAVDMVVDTGFRAVGKWTVENFLKMAGMVTLGIYMLGVARGWWSLPLGPGDK